VRVSHVEIEQRPAWQRTGNAFFPVAARMRGGWWVLRLNNFPDHPLWTLFVRGERRFDVDDTPKAWGRPSDPKLSLLSDADAVDALAPVKDFIAYGSEVGRPCDNPFCCG